MSVKLYWADTTAWNIHEQHFDTSFGLIFIEVELTGIHFLR